MFLKERANLSLLPYTKEQLKVLEASIPEVGSMSAAVDYLVKDYVRMKKELEFIDSQTLNAAKKMTAIDINMSIAVEMLTHLCYETATQIDEGLDYFKREDFNVDGKSVMAGNDPMYNFFRNRIVNYRKNKGESKYL